jgi:hypothetical protein
MGISCSKRITHLEPENLNDLDLESGSSRDSRDNGDLSEAQFNDKG